MQSTNRHQPHHRPIQIFGCVDSYAVSASALFFIPSLCDALNATGGLVGTGLMTYKDHRVARSPVFSGSSRISAPISRLPDRSQNLPYLTQHSLASEVSVLETFCSLLIVHSTIFIARQHTDSRYWYSKFVCLSVRYVPVGYQMKTA